MRQTSNRIFIHLRSNRVSTAHDRVAYVVDFKCKCIRENERVVSERARVQHDECDDIFIASTMNLICEPF